MSKKTKKRVQIILIAECLVLLVLLFLLVSPDEEERETDAPLSSGVDVAEGAEHVPGMVGDTEGNSSDENIPTTGAPEEKNTPDKEPTGTPTPSEGSQPDTEVIAKPNPILLQKEKADRLAAMYDYDAAIQLLKSVEGYENEPLLLEAIGAYEEAKAACVPWADNTKISHVFFHSLIVDTSLAFGPNSGTRDGYNRYMTTIDEFDKILQQMYDRGYVLIRIHDISEIVTQADGTEKMVMKEIMLPEGKIPFVMSQDDVNFYDYMDGEGFATKLVIGADGKPTCEYRKSDGTLITGAYDLVPMLDQFVEAHPDFSYRGAKAILAVTGYEGALGYETAPYRYDEVASLIGLSKQEKEAMLESERAACRQVVAALRMAGYEFASHSYGHGNMQTNTVEKYRYDMNRWLNEVGILIGDTDIYIYPFGADICDWHGYQGEKYEYAIACGFRYFCNVDSSQYWVQRKADYLRQGRINFDGERMNKNPEKLSYFFDVETVLDPTRPSL